MIISHPSSNQQQQPKSSIINIRSTQSVCLAVSPTPSSSSFSSPLLKATLAHLPVELLIEIFTWLPSLQHSLDRLSVCYVCKNWLGPAQIVLWRELWLGSCNSVLGLANALQIKPQLATLPRRLRFATSDPDYLATLDADAVFTALEKLVNLERFEVLVPYAMGDLYDSLCEDLAGSPIKEVVLGADEGIGRRHVQASMRFGDLKYLELIRLGTLEDLHSLEIEWTFPTSLSELVLIQPDLPGEDLRFLLSHTKHTLTKLRIDHGHLLPEETTQLEEDDLKSALIESGSQLKLIEIRWPGCNTPFLNDVIKSCYALQDLITSGPVCEPERIDQSCPKNLKTFVFDLLPNTLPKPEFFNLTSTEQRSSNLKKYYLKTALCPQESSWDTSVPLLEPLLTHDVQEQIDETVEAADFSNSSSLKSVPLQKNEWSDQSIQEWKLISHRFKLSGIEFVTDFF